MPPFVNNIKIKVVDRNAIRGASRRIVQPHVELRRPVADVRDISMASGVRPISLIEASKTTENTTRIVSESMSSIQAANVLSVRDISGARNDAKEMDRVLDSALNTATAVQPELKPLVQPLQEDAVSRGALKRNILTGALMMLPLLSGCSSDPIIESEAISRYAQWFIGHPTVSALAATVASHYASFIPRAARSVMVTAGTLSTFGLLAYESFGTKGLIAGVAAIGIAKTVDVIRKKIIQKKVDNGQKSKIEQEFDWLDRELHKNKNKNVPMDGTTEKLTLLKRWGDTALKAIGALGNLPLHISEEVGQMEDPILGKKIRMKYIGIAALAFYAAARLKGAYEIGSIHDIPLWVKALNLTGGLALLFGEFPRWYAGVGYAETEAKGQRVTLDHYLSSDPNAVPRATGYGQDGLTILPEAERTPVTSVRYISGEEGRLDGGDLTDFNQILTHGMLGRSLLSSFLVENASAKKQFLAIGNNPASAGRFIKSLFYYAVGDALSSWIEGIDGRVRRAYRNFRVNGNRTNPGQVDALKDLLDCIISEYNNEADIWLKLDNYKYKRGKPTAESDAQMGRTLKMHAEKLAEKKAMLDHWATLPEEERAEKIEKLYQYLLNKFDHQMILHNFFYTKDLSVEKLGQISDDVKFGGALTSFAGVLGDALTQPAAKRIILKIKAVLRKHGKLGGKEGVVKALSALAARAEQGGWTVGDFIDQAVLEVSVIDPFWMPQKPVLESQFYNKHMKAGPTVKFELSTEDSLPSLSPNNKNDKKLWEDIVGLAGRGEYGYLRANAEGTRIFFKKTANLSQADWAGFCESYLYPQERAKYTRLLGVNIRLKVNGAMQTLDPNAVLTEDSSEAVIKWIARAGGVGRDTYLGRTKSRSMEALRKIFLKQGRTVEELQKQAALIAASSREISWIDFAGELMVCSTDKDQCHLSFNEKTGEFDDVYKSALPAFDKFWEQGEINLDQQQFIQFYGIHENYAPAMPGFDFPAGHRFREGEEIQFGQIGNVKYSNHPIKVVNGVPQLYSKTYTESVGSACQIDQVGWYGRLRFMLQNHFESQLSNAIEGVLNKGQNITGQQFLTRVLADKSLTDAIAQMNSNLTKEGRPTIDINAVRIAIMGEMFGRINGTITEKLGQEIIERVSLKVPKLIVGYGLMAGREFYKSFFCCGTNRMLYMIGMMLGYARPDIFDNQSRNVAKARIEVNRVTGKLELFDYIPTYAQIPAANKLAPHFIRQIYETHRLSPADKKMIIAHYEGLGLGYKVVFDKNILDSEIPGKGDKVVVLDSNGNPVCKFWWFDPTPASNMTKSVGKAEGLKNCGFVRIDFQGETPVVSQSMPVKNVEYDFRNPPQVELIQTKLSRIYKTINYDVLNENVETTKNSIKFLHGTYEVANNEGVTGEITVTDLHNGKTRLTFKVAMPDVESTYIPRSGAQYAEKLFPEVMRMPWETGTEDIRRGYEGYKTGWVIKAHQKLLFLGEGPSNMQEALGQWYRWGEEGMRSYLESMVRNGYLYKNPNLMFSPQGEFQRQAYIWYPTPGLFDHLMIYPPALFWIGTHTEAGINTLISNDMYPWIYGAYLATAMGIYLPSIMKQGFGFKPIAGKEAMIKVQGPNLQTATGDQLKRNKPYVFRVTQTTSDRPPMTTQQLNSNLWRMGVSAASAVYGSIYTANMISKYGMPFMDSAISNMDWFAYGANVVFPIFLATLPLYSIHLHNGHWVWNKTEGKRKFVSGIRNLAGDVVVQNLSSVGKMITAGGNAIEKLAKKIDNKIDKSIKVKYQNIEMRYNAQTGLWECVHPEDEE